MRFDEQVVDLALRQVGAPYLWSARGDYVVRDERLPSGAVLAGQQFNVHSAQVGVPAGLSAFDCAGLVTWAAWKAGAADIRGWWGADTLYEHLPEYDASGERPGDCNRLVFYGALGGRATHVAIDIGRGLVIEAAGGDATTLTYQDALKRTRLSPWPAAVAVRREFRRDRLGSRSLLAAQHLPARPPGAYPAVPPVSPKGTTP